MCIELSNLMLTQVLDNLFEITLEKDFICSYVFPICEADSSQIEY